jgi:hypothetical protein
MDKLSRFEHNDVVAWLILGYLLSHPDAKDTVDGVEKWWLQGMEFSLDARSVQGSLERLVRWGWLVSSDRQGAGVVYGLNSDRREKLLQFLQYTADLR